MKRIIHIFVLFFITSYLSAQTDSIYAIVNGDSVTIHHNQTRSNCGSEYYMTFEIENFHIKLTEIDTGDLAYCNCWFDLATKIGPLESGNYTVDIFRDTKYYGSTSFVISNSLIGIVNPKKISDYQSDCYSLTAVENNINPEEFQLSPLYPNPFNPSLNINFTIPSNGYVKIEIYDQIGQLVINIFEDELEKGNHKLLWDASPYSSGLYFISVKFKDKIRTQKAMLLK